MQWLKEWRTDVKELEAKVREIKARLRTNWTSGQYRFTDRSFPGYDQWDLVKLKFTLTNLYYYRALKRNRYHTENGWPIGSYHLKSPDLSKYDRMLAEEIELRKQLQTILDLAVVLSEAT